VVVVVVAAAAAAAAVVAVAVAVVVVVAAAAAVVVVQVGVGSGALARRQRRLSVQREERHSDCNAEMQTDGRLFKEARQPPFALCFTSTRHDGRGAPPRRTPRTPAAASSAFPVTGITDDDGDELE
jgi:hypothetical protein